MQADETQNAKEPIAAQIDLSGQTLNANSFANRRLSACETAFTVQNSPYRKFPVQKTSHGD